MIHDLSRVVAVVDILHGQSVAAIVGNRESYQPTGIDVSEFIAAMVERGAAGIYIADLDAITNSGVSNSQDDWITSVAGRPLWIDAGSHRFQSNHAIPIVASECHLIDELDSLAPPAISLDYRGENFVGDDESAWRKWAIDTGCDVVLLDLQAVGTDSPTIVDRCRRIRDDGFSGRLLSGGGVRSDSECRRLFNAGVDLVMVGTGLR